MQTLVKQLSKIILTEEENSKSTEEMVAVSQTVGTTTGSLVKFNNISLFRRAYNDNNYRTANDDSENYHQESQKTS